MGGAYALDYSVLYARMDRLRLPDDEWQQLFDDIRVIEATALQQMRAAD
jgi:hypothetical protein